MRLLKNSLIKASAGTGKTFALATRMLRLMLLGVEPSQIVALTFSRAAAGEIFDQLVGRLAAAAASDAQAADEARNVFLGLGADLAQAIRARQGAALSRTLFTELLRRVIATQHLSMIGTIDSFMTRMVQAFPLELGLQGALTIMDDYRKACETDAAIAVLLNRGAATPEAGLFFEAFRQANFGKEGKAYAEKLAAFVATWHAALQDYPEARAWGRPEVIWPGGSPFPLHDTAEHLASRLAAEIRGDWEQAGREKAWDEFCDFVRTFNTTFPDKASVKNVLAAYQPQATSIEISYNRKTCCFTGEKARLILRTVETLYGLVIRARCEATQGICRLMEQIEAAYAQNTRSRGLLTFDDIPRLIAGLDASVRQNIEYRFDGRFRHWALDEFQDTSHAQWAAIRNLVDEVIQSADDERSIFIVGDSKQAIYGWRGGDVAIFEKEADSGHYDLSDLSLSYRYCPQIAGLVNRVFEGDRIAAALAPGYAGAGEKWRRLWVPHTSGRPAGFVSVERVAAPDRDAEEQTITPYLAAACAHLQRVRPWEKGLTAAILVRSNEHGKRFADALRSAGIPAVWEGESAICDTPVITALLHLLHVAEHPGDTLAWQHVCASPLAQSVFQEACAAPAPLGPARLSRKVLEDVARLGLDRTLRAYIGALDAASFDAFTRARLEDLIRAATRFTAEAVAETMLTDFTAFVETFITRDIAETSTVKILTIHRSKGLGFDFVLLPVIETTGLDTARAGALLCGGQDEWLLADPGRQVGEADSVLKAARGRQANDGVFEALCVQYVAMTRAKRALVMLLKPAAKAPSGTLYFSDCVADALPAGLPWSEGDAEWHRRPAAPEEAAAPALPEPVFEPSEKRQGIRRVTPSAAVFHGAPAGELFRFRESRASQRGTRLHEALSRIAWLEVADGQPPGLSLDEVDLTVASAFRDALRQPPHVTDLWRERAFELIAEGRWISGTFDRVVFFEEQGQRSAEIFDFKSNRRRAGETEAAFVQRMRETYAGQMAEYRRALSRLAGLDESAVRGTLLLADTLQAVPV